MVLYEAHHIEASQQPFKGRIIIPESHAQLVWYQVGALHHKDNLFDDLAHSRAVDIRSTGRTQCEQHLLCTKHCVCCFTFVISFNLTYEKNGAEISEKLITLSRAPMDVTC